MDGGGERTFVCVSNDGFYTSGDVVGRTWSGPICSNVNEVLPSFYHERTVTDEVSRPQVGVDLLLEWLDGRLVVLDRPAVDVLREDGLGNSRHRQRILKDPRICRRTGSLAGTSPVGPSKRSAARTLRGCFNQRGRSRQSEGQKARKERHCERWCTARECRCCGQQVRNIKIRGKVDYGEPQVPRQANVVMLVEQSNDRPVGAVLGTWYYIYDA